MAEAPKNTEILSPIKRAILELREMRAQLDKTERQKTEPIAIIGIGLRFPGEANNSDSFWHLLHNGVDAISPIPPDRWNLDEYFDPDPTTPGKMYTRGGGFIKETDLFDPQFFGIAPREAISMDPQQRLLLQVTWEALENAGQSPDDLMGSQTGIFIGISNNDYSRFVTNNVDNIDVHFATGNTFSVAAGRLSYFLGTQGPSMAIDTACSSSLVATHAACQSLRAKECNMALVGGVNLILSPEANINFSKAQMMARDDRCKTFDAAADGYVRGEGCAVVVLKRLSDAVAGHDNILAIIRGAAVNQDGRSSSLTAPNGPSQEAVIRQALTNAGVTPEQVNYIEAHGTGTSLGDPIEVQALAAALRENREENNPLLIGSVKTNIGHLEATAGIAGLIKVALALHHQEIPPHLHFHKPNPYIPWDSLPVKVATHATPWPRNQKKRIAGVSSFGFSGTNAHIILEEAPLQKIETPAMDRPLHILTLSAKRADALDKLINLYQTCFSTDTTKEISLADICFTANTGRAHLSHRIAVVSESANQAKKLLASFAAGEEPNGVLTGQTYHLDQSEIAFLFTGHGAQYINMGRQLYQTHPVFRQAIDECNELLHPYLEQSLLSVLYPNTDIDEENSLLLTGMTYSQPAIFAVGYALATLWRSWGVEPTMVMGHSVGEYIAACIAGVFTLADGLKLVAARGRLMDALPNNGDMVAVFADEEQVAQAIAPFENNVSMAAINGPKNIVISGDRVAIETIRANLKSGGVRSRRLAVAQASHSPLLEPILDEFEETVAEITFSSPEIGLISGVTGKVVATGNDVTNSSYWRQHLREAVRFSSVMETLHHEGYKIFIEIGTDPVLLGMGRRCLPDDYGIWIPSLRKDWTDWQQLLESVAALYVNGVEIDWNSFDQHYPRRRVPLPTYPWAKERYWVDVGKKQPEIEQPLWKTVVETGNRQAQQCPLDLAPQTYPAKWALLDKLTTAFIIRAFQQVGVFCQPGKSYAIDDLLKKFNFLPPYKKLLLRWLHRLVEAGILTHNAHQFTASYALPDPNLAEIQRQVAETLSDIPFLADYINRCGEMLIDVLTGAENALETLFPEGSTQTADHLYHHWSLVRYFNGINEAVLKAVLKTVPAGKQLKILEIGAGTGGTTAALVPHLPPKQTSYYFTDLSNLFLDRAKEKFNAFPFMRYKLLNIEQNPFDQEFTPQSFNVIVAANVLHATRNLDETLKNVLSLLAPDGLLLLFEATHHLSWFDITTSLIEGWNIFEDDWRNENPLLPATLWEDALRANGFENVAIFPKAGSVVDTFGQHVLVAQATTNKMSLAEAGGDSLPEQTSGNAQGPSSEEPGKDKRTAALMHQLDTALPDERRELLLAYVRGYVTKILRLAPNHRVDRRHRLMDLGLDSLMAVELRNRLGTDLKLKRKLPATLIFDHPTIEAIAIYLEKELFPENDQVTFSDLTNHQQLSGTGGEDETTEVDVESLSDEEVETLLLKKLKDL